MKSVDMNLTADEINREIAKDSLHKEMIEFTTFKNNNLFHLNVKLNKNRKLNIQNQ